MRADRAQALCRELVSGGAASRPEPRAEQQAERADDRNDGQDTLNYRGLALLRLSAELSPGEATREDLAGVAAFYASDERAVTVLDQGGALDDTSSVMLLAHELVHAQQDVEHGFDALWERYVDSYDAGLALSSLTEGEATLYADQLGAYAYGFELDDVRWGPALRRFRVDRRQEAVDSGSPVVLLRRVFTYPYGTSYVYRAFEATGRAGVAALYDAPPTSTQEVLRGYGAEAPEGGFVEPHFDQDAVPMLLPEQSIVSSVRYGAFAFEIALAHWQEYVRGTQDPSVRAGTIAAELRADALTVLLDLADNAPLDPELDDPQPANVIASWRLRFANAAAAEDAVRAIEPAMRFFASGTRIAVDERDMMLIAPSDPQLLDGVDLAELDWGPAPERNRKRTRVRLFGCCASRSRCCGRASRPRQQQQRAHSGATRAFRGYP